MSQIGLSPAAASRDRPAPHGGGADGKVRVLVVDDSLTVRTVFERLLEKAGGFLLAGSVSTAEAALEHLRSSPADVILLDLEMPGMGGLKALPEILRLANGGQVLVVSAVTADGAQASVSALTMGAADTMLKPKSGGFTPEYRASLLQKIRALGHGSAERAVPAAAIIADRPPLAPISRRSRALLIGASTGGIHAISQFVQALPVTIDQPIFVTQHLPRSFIPVFARQLGTAARREAVLAVPGTIVQKGRIYVAPGDGHLVLTNQGLDVVCERSDHPAASGCQPSVDPMFASAARVYSGDVTAIVLSGMGRDGLQGAQDIADAGGTILAQDAGSSAVWGMPGAVTKAGLVQSPDTPANLAHAIARGIGRN